MSNGGIRLRDTSCAGQQPRLRAQDRQAAARIHPDENIVRLREKGMEADAAAIEGTTQVWGALVASTATTVVIFLPIIFLQDVSGQLFADLALVISVAVSASLVIAVTTTESQPQG